MDPKKHSGDCTIYASLINDVPEAGLCICGYGYEYFCRNNGDISELYSKELIEKLENERNPISKKDLDNLYNLLNDLSLNDLSD